jgi:hypothetical protein
MNTLKNKTGEPAKQGRPFQIKLSPIEKQISFVIIYLLLLLRRCLPDFLFDATQNPYPHR